MYQHRYHSALLLLVLWCVVCTFSSDVTAYVSPAIKQRWKAGFAEKDATDVIEACIEEGYENEDLFCAVKYMDRFANDIYRDPAKKQSLMDKTKGSWELRLALNDDRDQSFYPHPEFRSFAMAFISIDDDYFGKGIAPNTDFCFVSLGGPSTRNVKRRQIFMEYEDYYISGNTVPGWDLSYYLRGYQNNWAAKPESRPPLGFTVIACTDKAMVVRGSKTGGIALFRRVKGDMRPVAGFT